jgi:hypothetical protein
MKNTDPIDNLFQKPVYDYQDGQDNEFLHALLVELSHHENENEQYQNFLKRHGFTTSSKNIELSDIPFIPVQVFKLLGSTLSSVRDEDIYSKLESSATSGIPSTVLIDRVTSRRQVKAMTKVISDYIGSFRRPFLIVDIDPKSKDRNVLGARGAAIRGYLNFASEAQYFIEQNHAGHLSVLLDKLINHIHGLKESAPLVVFGFTYVLYEHLIKVLLEKNLVLSLPKGSKVLHIGGWKKLESVKVHKDVFNSNVSKVFNIDASDVIDVYGFTEQMGLNYPDCEYGWKHIPQFARVLVRDPRNYNILPQGQEGMLEFLTPIPHSYPGNAVLTDDIGYIDDGICECGRRGGRFKVIGRAKKAEIRGCGDVIGEKTKNILPLEIFTNGSENSLSVYNAGIHTTNSDSIEGIVEGLKSKQAWLSSQPVNALIGLIEKVSLTWLDDHDLSVWKLNGLGFLVNWCSSNNLQSILNQSLRYHSGALDQFISITGEYNRQAWRANPRGLVCHWLSGNVPLLGMLTLVQSILTKNVNLIKVSSGNDKALPLLLESFRAVEYKTPGGYTIKGDDLLDTIAVIYYSSADRKNAEAFSLAADVRLAWGGADAINAICSLPSRAGAEDLIFGPKTSCSVIACESISNERSLRKILRKTATDVSSFDQTACASPHTVFVERGGLITPEDFAEKLGAFMDKALITIPKEAEDSLTVNNIMTARAVGDFLGKYWRSDEYEWTVLLNTNIELASPTYSRVITIVPVEDIMQVIKLLNNEIQTVGLAAEGDKRLEFAERAAKRGVFRFPEIGRMTNFDVPWDGIFAADRMVSWASLGGPNI